MPYYLNHLSTPIGTLSAVASTEALVALEFSEATDKSEELKLWTSKFQQPVWVEQSDLLANVAMQLEAYFDGKRKSFDLPFCAQGTAFQQKVWNLLQKIPYATTTSYGKQAVAYGNTLAIRAVARANGANPIAIVIPCHRVVGATGNLTGYAGGLWRKQWLLNHELKNRS